MAERGRETPEYTKPVVSIVPAAPGWRSVFVGDKPEDDLETPVIAWCVVTRVALDEEGYTCPERNQVDTQPLGAPVANDAYYPDDQLGGWAGCLAPGEERSALAGVIEDMRKEEQTRRARRAEASPMASAKGQK